MTCASILSGRNQANISGVRRRHRIMTQQSPSDDRLEGVATAALFRTYRWMNACLTVLASFARGLHLA